MAWGDYDNDGDLDILLTGNADPGRIARVYRNEVGEANTPPSAPTGLAAVASASTVNLSWTAAEDAETQSAGLSYNVRIGTAPGAADVLSPMAVGSGRRLLPQSGNANLGTSAWLELPEGTYYWSVQAVDAGWTGGPFADEGSFAILSLQAGFTAQSSAGVAPLEVTFTNTSLGEYTSSLWDFGDTITSTLTSPLHTYTAAGLYTVTLTVSGPAGSDTLARASYIDAYPVLPDPGACNTDLAIQNLGAQEANVAATFTTANTATAWTTVLAPTMPRASLALPYSQFGGAAAGAWAGAGDVGSSEPVAAVVQMFWDNAATSSKAAATYSGVVSPTTTAYLPLLITAPGYRTDLTIQNTGQAEAAVSITFRDRAGAPATKALTVAAGSETTIDLSQVPEADFSATDGLGAAEVTADCAIAVVAAVHWPHASDAYSVPGAGATTLLAPGAVRRLNADGRYDWSELVVQNLGSTAASVQVEFVGHDGTVTHMLVGMIPARGTMSYGTSDLAASCCGTEGDDWIGTVRVTGTAGQALTGVGVARLPSLGVADNLAWNVASAAIARPLAFPAVYRRLAGADDDRWSAILVHNAAATAGTVDVAFYDAGGAQVGETYTVLIPAGGQVRLSLKDGLDLPQAALDALGTGFSGSLWLTPSTGVEIAGVAETFWPAEGRAAGYAGLVAP
ncbi:MAG TPA: DUF5719 family protein [Anaerolineae bacterium]|nr:DUF5719 family protein [Anaerolineae bacterium]HOR00826.1 DUF5719 family protein [Anaerolineae bacterium]HPL28030.1 DUF5719 family protein [Anaerolineae bacterium]